MLGTFQKDFFPSGNFPNVQIPKRQLPKSVLAATLGPIMFLAPYPSFTQRSTPIVAYGASEGLT